MTIDDKIKTLKKFDEVINRLKDSDLAWHDLCNPQGIAKRKEVLAKRHITKSFYGQPFLDTVITKTNPNYVYPNISPTPQQPTAAASAVPAIRRDKPKYTLLGHPHRNLNAVNTCSVELTEPAEGIEELEPAEN